MTDVRPQLPLPPVCPLVYSGHLVIRAWTERVGGLRIVVSFRTQCECHIRKELIIPRGIMQLRCFS